MAKEADSVSISELEAQHRGYMQLLYGFAAAMPVAISTAEFLCLLKHCNHYKRIEDKLFHRLQELRSKTVECRSSS